MAKGELKFVEQHVEVTREEVVRDWTICNSRGFETRTSVSNSSRHDHGNSTIIPRLPLYQPPTAATQSFIPHAHHFTDLLQPNMIVKLTIALALTLGGIYAALLLLRRRSLNKDDGAEGPAESFSDGDSAYYCKKGKHPFVVKICKVHHDDKWVPFYTIRLPNGSERNTVGRYLKRDPKDNGDDDTIDNMERPSLFGKILSVLSISNPWIVFIFYTSREHQKVVVMEAADEALADLDLAHSWPSLGSLPRNFGILLMLGYFLGMHSLTRLAVIGFKAFGAYYAMLLPYTYLTRPYYKYRESHQEAQYS